MGLRCLWKLLRISYWEHTTNDWVQSKINFLTDPARWPRLATTSPKLFFWAPWRVGNGAVGIGNAGWTASKSGLSYPCHHCSQWPPAEKTGRKSLLNYPSRLPDDPIRQGTEGTDLGRHNSRAWRTKKLEQFSLRQWWMTSEWCYGDPFWHEANTLIVLNYCAIVNQARTVGSAMLDWYFEKHPHTKCTCGEDQTWLCDCSLGVGPITLIRSRPDPKVVHNTHSVRTHDLPTNILMC